MLSKKVLSFAMTATLALGFMSGCASNTNSDSGDSGDKKVIKIVTQSPLSGGSATLGEAIKLGAQLAIDQQKDKFAELGFELKLDAQDDQGDPKKGVANANLVVADKSVLGVVGHLNSGVSIPASEVYEKNNLVSVSPASTATDYTDRGLKTVSRVVARDDFQGPAGAQYAVETLGAKKIFVVQDKTAYGSGLADAFKEAAEDLGAEVVGYEGITVGEKDFNGVLNQVASKKPDLIYYGGLYAEGGILVKQAREKGLDIPFMGGDGLDSSTFVEIAGDAVKNTFITSVAGDTTQSEEGTKFAEDYKAAFSKNIESYSAYAYDSAAVLLAGIEKAIKENDNKLPTREEVTKAVRATQDYRGVVTEVGFDEKGDNKFAKIFIYKFDEAKYPATLDGEISQ
ncbi:MULTISPECIES: branched-chain amino acid ABC transporter substrate-binding protein [Niallia]|jgi:branched-chain amino acid transport system substrate-binding protein|uniref:branched-chain amino acid ABC transporter substrate-binding protein n=1 Tax=Niallia TaxID=2837506 RepID=UPI00148F7399|nr:branched-chain amino acid ABC transporter substrate-binding protein [Niallia circulans]QJX60985.1 branched-chain amino acid ABC transporter substrate-binding protein [Niallia circulans]